MVAAVGGTPDLPEMCCPTACAALLWSQFSAYQRPLAAALRWLQQCDPSAPHAPAHALPGYPPRRGAWFWNEPPGGALDPAGIAILALCRNQLTGHQRIIESVEWILARASHSDGWHAGPDRRERSNQVSDVGYTGTLLLTLRAAGLATPPERYRLKAPPRDLELDRPEWAGQSFAAVGRYAPEPGETPPDEAVRVAAARTDALDQLRRHVIPMTSHMVITEPLSPAIWEEIGWERREVLGGFGSTGV